MKLSEKGKRKILDNRYWFMNEFEQEDFQGAVILTVEEAKCIWEMLEDNENYFPEGFWEMADWLKNKIEQAEKGYEVE